MIDESDFNLLALTKQSVFGIAEDMGLSVADVVYIKTGKNKEEE